MDKLERRVAILERKLKKEGKLTNLDPEYAKEAIMDKLGVDNLGDALEKVITMVNRLEYLETMYKCYKKSQSSMQANIQANLAKY